jgi:DNA-binding NarL/FixJ family response regulator
MNNKIGIIDDHPIIRETLKELFQKNGYSVQFTCATKLELFEQIQTNDIDILILDIVIPDVTGLEIVKEILKLKKAPIVLAYTSLSSPILVENLFNYGVSGYVNKTQNLTDIIDAIITVSSGVKYIPSEYDFIKKRIRESETELLTEREKELLELLSQEHTSKEIANKLCISINTVETHRKNLFFKLKVKNLAGLIREGFRNGYLPKE